MNKRQIKKTNRKLRELLDAYGKTFHHPNATGKTTQLPTVVKTTTSL